MRERGLGLSSRFARCRAADSLVNTQSVFSSPENMHPACFLLFSFKFYFKNLYLFWCERGDLVFRLALLAAEPQTPSLTLSPSFQVPKTCIQHVFFCLVLNFTLKICIFSGAREGTWSFVSLCSLQSRRLPR